MIYIFALMIISDKDNSYQLFYTQQDKISKIHQSQIFRNE